MRYMKKRDSIEELPIIRRINILRKEYRRLCYLRTPTPEFWGIISSWKHVKRYKTIREFR